MTIKRMTFMQELLSFVGLAGRLHLDWISSAEAGKFAEVSTKFTEKLRKMGPNPLSNYRLEEWLALVRERNRSITVPGKATPPQPRPAYPGREGAGQS